MSYFPQSATYLETSVVPHDWTHTQWSDDRKFLLNGEDPAKWSGNDAPPAIGSRVKLQKYGEGQVVAYFVEHRFLGLLVKLDTVPADLARARKHRKQPVDLPMHAFGIDLL